MATLSERLQIIISADTRGAVREIDALGKTTSTRLGAAGKSAEGFSASLDKVGTKMVSVGAKTTAAGAIMAAGLYNAALAAQDLADSVDKAQATFGKAGATALSSFAENAATNLGKSKAAALDAASAYGLLLKQQGIGGTQLAGQAAQLATITADLAERFKKPYEEVQKSIESVLKTGSAKSLKGLLGVDIQIDPNSLKGLSGAERTTKVLNELFRQTSDSAGFFAKSTDDLGVQIATAQAKWDNAKASFGEASLPALTSLAEAVTGLLDLFNELPDGVKSAIGTIAAFGTAASLVSGPLSVIGGIGAKAFAPLVAEGGALGGIMSSLGVTAGGASAALAPLALVAVGAGAAFEAWASETVQVDKQVEALTSSVLGLTDASQTLPTLATSLQSILSVNAGGQDVFAKTGLSISEVTKAVNAAPGSFDKFRDEVDGLGGSLENLGGLFDLGGGIDGIREQADKAGPAVAGIVDKLADLYEAGVIDDSDFRAAIDYFTDLDKGAQSSSKALAQQAKDLRDTAGAAQLSGAALADFKIATDETAGLDKQVAALARLREALAGNSTTADDAGKAITTYADRVAAAAERIAGKQQDLTLGGLQAEINSPARVALSYEQASIRVQQAQKRLADLNSPSKRQEELTAALEKVTDAQDGLTDAIERRRKAQERLNDLTKKSVVAGSVPLLQEITKAADAGLKDAEARAAATRAQYGAGSKEDVAAQGLVTAAQGRKTESMDLLSRGLAEQGGKNQREIRDAQAEVRSADRDVAKAVRDRRDAESEYNDVLKSGGDNALERKQAELELAGALLDYTEAAANLAQATKDGLDPFGALRDVIANAGAAAGLSQGEIDGLVASIATMGTEAAKAFAIIAPLLNGTTTAEEQAARRDATRPSATKGGLGGGTQGGTGSTAGITSPPREATQKLGPTTYRNPKNGDIYQWDGTKWRKLTATEAARVALGPGGGGIVGFATGGMVGGTGFGDTVPAMLTPGEFVLTRTAANHYGTEALKSLNKGTARIQKFAQGGTVRGPVSVPAASFSSSQTPARTSAQVGRSVEVKPVFNITATDPTEAADETVRKLRRATFLAGVR